MPCQGCLRTAGVRTCRSLARRFASCVKTSCRRNACMQVLLLAVAARAVSATCTPQPVNPFKPCGTHDTRPTGVCLSCIRGMRVAAKEVLGTLRHPCEAIASTCRPHAETARTAHAAGEALHGRNLSASWFETCRKALGVGRAQQAALGQPSGLLGSLLHPSFATCRPDELRYYAEKYGPVKDVYLPRDFYTK